MGMAACGFGGAVAGSEAVHTILYCPFLCLTSFNPIDVGRGGGDAGSGNVGHFGAVGTEFKRDIVDIGRPRSAEGTDGHIVAVSVEILERNMERSPSGRVGHRDGTGRLEGSVVVGVGHDTHLERGVVGVGLGPEGQTEVV